jgi:NAD+ synthase
LVLGLRNYVAKTGASNVLIEQAEGNDTALAAAIARDALGAENVRQIDVPLSDNLHAALRDELAALGAEVSAETLTPPLRGLMLRAMADDAGEMLLTAQNKSAAAMGTVAVSGDFNPVKDLYQTEVQALCDWRSKTVRAWMQGPAPSPTPDTEEARAEDAILHILLEDGGNVDDCVAAGHAPQSAQRLAGRIAATKARNGPAVPGPRLKAATA